MIVVTGPPASGKSTIAEAIARTFSLPLLSKDDIKEVLFDALGRGDRAWSRQLGRTTFFLLLHLLELQLKAGRSVVVEANFTPSLADASLRQLRTRVPFRALQIYCTGDADTLLDRFADRASQRHPGHLDNSAETWADLRAAIKNGHHGQLDLGGELITVDTTLADVDLDWLNGRVAGHLRDRTQERPG